MMPYVLIIICVVLSCAPSSHAHEAADYPRPFVYMAVGASDATGVGTASANGSYVDLITHDLKRSLPHLSFINLGVSGARIGDMMRQVERAQQRGTKADLVTLWAGTNDLIHGDDPEEFSNGLHAMLHTLREIGSPAIVIANIPDLTRLPHFHRHPNPRVTLDVVSAYNRVIEHEARESGARLVDLFSPSLQEEWVFPGDGFHPSEAGHRELARRFLQMIHETIGIILPFESFIASR